MGVTYLYLMVAKDGSMYIITSNEVWTSSKTHTLILLKAY